MISGEIIEKVYWYGIVGLGGVVFLIVFKFSFVDKCCKLLIINGVECEFYIICDDCLM